MPRGLPSQPRGLETGHRVGCLGLVFKFENRARFAVDLDDGFEDRRPVHRSAGQTPMLVGIAIYVGRGTAEQHIKEGKFALKWTQLSCMKFAANAVRLRLRLLAYNLANFLRTLATPRDIETWSLTSLRERLIKTDARLARHGR